MELLYNIIIGLFILFALLAIIWRVASHHLSFPCPAWLGWIVEMENPFFKNYRPSEIVKNLSLEPGMKVLDLGCGPGRLTVPIAKIVGTTGEVTAFDIQSAMLNRTQAKVQAENLKNVRFVQGGAGEGKLEKEYFDRVLLVTVLGEIPDKIKAMTEVFNCLKSGGILSITEVIADPHYLSRKFITKVANSVGFVEKEFFGNRFSFTINFVKP